MKLSLFQRISGALKVDDADDIDDADEKDTSEQDTTDIEHESISPTEGRLTVDMYQTNEHVVIQSIVAGVKKDDLEISLSRDKVTIRGKRERETSSTSTAHSISSINDTEYIHEELYWGTFSRTISLPDEVDIDLAEASEVQGLLTLTLPKTDKHRETKLKVKMV